MKINLKNISIRDRIYAIIFLFLSSALFSAFTLNYFQAQSGKHHLQLSASYHIQDQISDLNETCAEVFNRNIFDSREKIELQRKAITNNIHALTQGGKFSGFDKKLSPLKEEAAEIKNAVTSSWKECLINLDPVLNLPQKMDSIIIEDREISINDSTSQIIQIERVVLVNNIELKKAIISANKSFQRFKNANQKIITEVSNQLQKSYTTYIFVFVILGLINVGIFIFSFFWIRNKVVTPIKTVGKQANIVANGDLNASIEYNKDDEIGTISYAINSMAKYLRNASEFVHQIGEGNLDSRFKDLNDDQIIEGSLAHSLISMKEKLRSVAREDEKRNWATKGVAQFADLIRKNNSNLKDLSSSIMSELVMYTKTTQGCIYIHEKDENEKDYLILNAFYAFDSEKFFKDKVMLGEGIVGQTFLEKKTTYLVEIPENYMKLKSGLGSIDPVAVLVVPIIINSTAFGVIELAAFKEIEQYKIEFIEQLGEMIASAISNVRNNEQTKILLEESQQLAEQMKSQEEEMRQNMEELSATQEEMARKEMQTQSIISSIEHSFGTSELTWNGDIITSNKLFAEYCNSEVDKLIGKNINLLISSSESQNSNEYWGQIEAGNTITQVFKIGDNKAQITLSPIKSSGNDFDKVLVFAQLLDDSIIGQTSVNTDELHEELQQNMDSLSLTEQSLQERINYFQSLDSAVGLAHIKFKEALFMNSHFMNSFGLKKNKISIENLFEAESVIDIQKSIENKKEKSIKCIINEIEIKLEVLPLQNAGEAILLIHA